jgi:2-haloalkanoic acid dehalogenase type II
MTIGHEFDAILFDLLTALLDSRTLWDAVAGGASEGRSWRAAYLRRTYETGAYRPYEALVAEAAAEVGLAPALAGRLAARYGELKPWPEVLKVLGALRGAGLRLGIVTNCSEALGATAVKCVGIAFDVIVTAERSGHYKPDPRPYKLALAELGIAADRCLFVAGSAYDLFGTSKVGLPAYWHNRLGMLPPPNAPAALEQHASLRPLLERATKLMTGTVGL